MDIIWVSYIVFLLLNTFVFMFQRTTLEISRSHGGSNIEEMQISMTPIWMGVIGWISTIGVWGSVLLIIFTNVWWYGVIAGVSVFIIQAVIPIPRAFFYKLTKH